MESQKTSTKLILKRLPSKDKIKSLKEYQQQQEQKELADENLLNNVLLKPFKEILKSINEIERNYDQKLSWELDDKLKVIIEDYLLFNQKNDKYVDDSYFSFYDRTDTQNLIQKMVVQKEKLWKIVNTIDDFVKDGKTALVTKMQGKNKASDQNIKAGDTKYKDPVKLWRNESTQSEKFYIKIDGIFKKTGLIKQSQSINQLSKCQNINVVLKKTYLGIYWDNTIDLENIPPEKKQNISDENGTKFVGAWLNEIQKEDKETQVDLEFAKSLNDQQVQANFIDDLEFDSLHRYENIKNESQTTKQNIKDPSINKKPPPLQHKNILLEPPTLQHKNILLEPKQKKLLHTDVKNHIARKLSHKIKEEVFEFPSEKTHKVLCEGCDEIKSKRIIESLNLEALNTLHLSSLNHEASHIQYFFVFSQKNQGKRVCCLGYY